MNADHLVYQILSQAADNPSLVEANFTLNWIYKEAKQIYESKLRADFDTCRSAGGCESIIDQAIRLKLNDSFISELKQDYAVEFE